MDRAAKAHDLAYATSSDLDARHRADYELENRAWERVKSKDSALGEKFAAYVTTNLMKAKRRLGMGLKRKRPRVGRGVQFKSLIAAGRKAVKNAPPGAGESKLAGLAVKAAKKARRSSARVKLPRIIRVPKLGGFLPLLPTIAALSALGSLAGGVANVVRTVNEIRQKKNTTQQQPTKVGGGLYLHRTGRGLYLKPFTAAKKN